VIGSFKDRGTEDIFNGANSKKARASLSANLMGVARRKLSQIQAARALEDLHLPGNHLEALKGSRAGQWSIRINDQYRVCFIPDGSNFQDVEIVDYH
jgi:proteic killer suppression protein